MTNQVFIAIIRCLKYLNYSSSNSTSVIHDSIKREPFFGHDMFLMKGIWQNHKNLVVAGHDILVPHKRMWQNYRNLVAARNKFPQGPHQLRHSFPT